MLWGHGVKVRDGSGGLSNTHNNVITNKHFAASLISLPAVYE